METLSQSLKANAKNTKLFRIIFLSVMAALIIICTFFDKQISDALYFNGNKFGEIFSKTFFLVGYVPAIFVDSVLFACCFCLVKNKWLKALFAFLVYSTLFGAIYTVFESFPTAGSGIKFGVCGGVATLAVFPVIYGMGKLKEDALKKLFYIFLFGAIMATLAFMFVAAFQFTWGRDRYFAIIAGEDFEYFINNASAEVAKYTAWYLPQGGLKAGNVAYRSFPSMHSSSAASMVMLILLAWKFNYKKSVKITLYVVAVLVMICVPLSRIVMGWHFATDVLFGFLFAYASAELALYITDKRFATDQTQIE